MNHALEFSGFPDTTRRVTDCAMCEISVLFNGGKLDQLTPCRGSDKETPYRLIYSFVMSMEYLSLPIDKEVGRGNWCGIKVARRALPTTQLPFADDIILLGQVGDGTLEAI